MSSLGGPTLKKKKKKKVVWLPLVYSVVPESYDVSGFEEEVVVAHVIGMAVSANNKVNVVL